VVFLFCFFVFWGLVWNIYDLGPEARSRTRAERRLRTTTAKRTTVSLFLRLRDRWSVNLEPNPPARRSFRGSPNNVAVAIAHSYGSGRPHPRAQI